MLPLEAGVHAGVEGSFTILTFPPELDGTATGGLVNTTISFSFMPLREQRITR